MINVVYPALKPKIKNENEAEFIFCLIRKRWMIITPEEWVRQNFLLYLTEVLGFSKSLIAVEKRIKLGEMYKRFDIVVYNQQSEPYIIVECKEPAVTLSAATVSQVLRYNINLQAPCLVITNGHFCFAFQTKGNQFIEAQSMPLPQ